MNQEVTRFEDWMHSAKKGERFIYAHKTPHLRGGCSGAMAATAYAAYMSGHVVLVQKRLSKSPSRGESGRFDYIAVRTELDTL